MPDTRKASEYPVATKLGVGYSDLEDRLVLMLRTRSHGVRGVLVTRRMMRVLLEHYADTLKRTSTTAARAPAAVRDEVLRMEHVGALSGAPLDKPAGPGPTDGPADGPAPLWVAVELTIVAEAGTIIIAFVGQQRHTAQGDGSVNEPVVALTLDRRDAHRVLHLLVRKSREAGWDLDRHAAWLTEDGAAPDIAGGAVN